MANYQEIQEVKNVTIVKSTNGRFGLIDSSNSIVLEMQYDSIIPFREDKENRLLRLEKNGFIGIYDAKCVEFVQYCTLVKITKIDFAHKEIKGKEPIFKRTFLKNVSFLCWDIKIDLP